MKNISNELENAFNKELNLIKNDLYYQQVEFKIASETTYVRMDVLYKPLEILAGDSYSIRKSHNDKIVFFLLDAMGKGVSASITATSSTILLNYIFNQMNAQKNFEFKRWIQRFLDYIKGDLLDNESLSITFFSYDKKTTKVEYASFGMPAFLIEGEDFSFKKIKSNNMPICKYSDTFKINSFISHGMKKALIYTDGLCENKLENGKFYKEQMYQDFIDSYNIVDFTKKVREQVTNKDDDLTLIYINSITLYNQFHKINMLTNKVALDEVLIQISNFVKSNGASIKNQSEISLALSELLTNALEHGVYGISNSKKSFLIENGDFDSYMKEAEVKYKDKHIQVEYSIREEGESRIFVCRINDGGKGFDTKILKDLVVNPQSFNGRGIMIIKKLIDRMYYNETGNTIVMRKYLD